MADRSAIQWTDATWNPTTGCDQISPGCANCYAKTWAARGLGTFAGGRPFEDVRVHEDRLQSPLRWKKPRRIFVDSMSDLFHEAVPDAFIDRVFAVMALAPQHTFQILTKRAERMRDYFATTRNGCSRHAFVAKAWMDYRLDRGIINGTVPDWPLPNVWLGVSCENQHFADERIPLLLQTPAAIRFISYEPALGPVSLDRFTCGECGKSHGLMASTKAMKSCSPCCLHCDEHGGPRNAYWLGRSPSARADLREGLDWVIVGGESGPGARPFDVAWARAVVAQCQAAGVPVFVKQLGASPMGWANPDGRGEKLVMTLRDRKGGDMAEWPEDLRVREFPGGVQA